MTFYRTPHLLSWPNWGKNCWLPATERWRYSCECVEWCLHWTSWRMWKCSLSNGHMHYGTIYQHSCLEMATKDLRKYVGFLMVIPHSNADEERVFSMVRKNKTPFRPSLSFEKTLSSLLTVKLVTEEPCHKFEPTSSVIERAGNVTWEYNKEHCKSV